MENTKTNYMEETKLADHDIRRVSRRWIMGSQITWNYERMMGVGYLYAILPVLRKLYKGEQLKQMMKNQVQFFNTTPHMGGFILGIDMAAELENGYEGREAVGSIKTGLMGPFAGVGDTIFGVLIPTIFGSIAAYMALSGNVTGVALWLLVNLVILGLRYLTVGMGYRQGMKLVTSAKDKLGAMTHAATVLGVTVVGALIATVVRANVTASFHTGDVTLAGQDVLDQIMPKLIPALFVFFIYWLLGRKKMTSTKAIMLTILISIVLGAVGFLG